MSIIKNKYLLVFIFYYGIIPIKVGEKMTVGENIRKIRKEKGLTQKQLGERLNMTQSAIGQFEKAKTSPKLETVEKIAHALDVHAAELMGLSAYISELRKETSKQTAFFDFLDSIGYRIHDINFDGKWGITIEESGKDIYITHEEMDILKYTTKENIDLRISKYISDGKHNQ